MNNIPLFPSQGGTATLILREIPHKKTAYIILQSVVEQKLSTMIRECAAFCRGCGAEICFVSAADHDLAIPLKKSHEIRRMAADKSQLPSCETPFRLVPITPDNDSIYQRIYNLCFTEVSNSLTYDRAQIKRIYDSGHRGFLALTEEDVPCGMGELHGNELAAVALLPQYRGRGKDLTLSLLALCEGPEITLTVSTDNTAALKVYTALGFVDSGLESAWHPC